MNRNILKLVAFIAVLSSVIIFGVNYMNYQQNIASDGQSPVSDNRNTVLASNQAGDIVNDCIAFRDVTEAQRTWGDAIVAIGKAYQEGGDYRGLAADIVDSLYAYDEGKVLFKPTKAAKDQFRLSESEAVSYFVTGVVNEDDGFATQPWSNVRFENAETIVDCNYALAMGNYYFTDARTNRETKVEYTFGYRKARDGSLLIDLHHSSLPYNPNK